MNYKKRIKIFKRNERDVKLLKIITIIMAVIICMTSTMQVANAKTKTKAKKDSKKPTITLSLNKKNITKKPIKLEIKVNDASKIKEVNIIKESKKNSKKTILKLDSKSIAKFTISSNGTYKISATDSANNKSTKKIKVNNIKELKATWISFLEFDKLVKTTSDFTTFKKEFDKILDRCVDLNMNAVVVQVRSHGDALYPSKYFPWSAHISGKQGKGVNFDPVAYMVAAAHKRGLEFHAWINPYRIATSTSISSLSDNNQARKWRESEDEDKKRNVLSFDGSLYYNPSKKDVRNLITNGVKEVVKKYDVDGIHFDDYFYPSLNAKYKTNFDAKEYNEYKEKCNENDITPKSIVDWRRNNVNILIKNVYSEIKEIKPYVSFGISPAGSIKNLNRVDAYYVDIKKWLSSSNYVDYICPQIYWAFGNKVCPYDKTVDDWNKLNKSKTVSMYIGIANYRAGAKLPSDIDWSKQDDILKRQIEYARNTKRVDGFMFFRYDFFNEKRCQKEIENLMDVL